jgi:hypothetical protein
VHNQLLVLSFPVLLIEVPCVRLSASVPEALGSCAASSRMRGYRMDGSCIAALGTSREVDTAAAGVAARKGETTSQVGTSALGTEALEGGRVSDVGAAALQGGTASEEGEAASKGDVESEEGTVAHKGDIGRDVGTGAGSGRVAAELVVAGPSDPWTGLSCVSGVRMLRWYGPQRNIAWESFSEGGCPRWTLDRNAKSADE